MRDLAICASQARLSITQGQHGNGARRTRAISREEKARLYTGAVPSYAFAENRVGSVELGKLANFNPIGGPADVDANETKNIVAETTIGGGRVEFARGSGAARHSDS